MPVACSSNALTGSSGAVYYTPSGTKACLKAADFADAGVITVLSDNDFRVGDPVKFSLNGSAVIDTLYTVDTAYVVTAVDDSGLQVTVATAAAPGTPLGSLNSDGADNGGHVEMTFEPAAGICEVREFSVEMSRDSIDVTTLPCAPSSSAGGQKWAQPRKNQPGTPEITGTLTLLITDNADALSTRLMESTFLNNQDGASVALFIDLASDGASPPQPDYVNSTAIRGEVQFTDFSTAVNSDDATTAEVSFTMWKVDQWIGQIIS